MSARGTDDVSALPPVNDDTIRECDDRAFRAWPSEETLNLSGWIVRHAAQAGTRRINSVYPARMSEGIDLDVLVDQVEGRYAGYGLPTQFQISPASSPGGLDERLKDRGYQREAPTAVEWARCRDVRLNPGHQQHDNVDISENMSDDWAVAYRYSLLSDQELSARRAVIDRIKQPKALAKLTVNGETVSIGLGVYDTGWAGVFCMFTRPENRRRGYAHRVLNALTQWTVSNGGESMYLLVVEDNDVARTFYRERGFSPAYGYHYRAFSD